MTPTTMLSFTETVAAFLNGPVTVSRRYMGPHRRESPSPRPYMNLDDAIIIVDAIDRV